MTVEELKSISQDHPIILYDGVCVLCNNFIQFVDKRDKQNRFRYAMLQEKAAQEIIKELSLHEESEETVMLMYKSKTFVYSDVSLEVSKSLGWPYKAFSIFSIIPKVIRDNVYLWIARNRYSWFGKSDVCIIPEGNLKDKLLQ